MKGLVAIPVLSGLAAVMVWGPDIRSNDVPPPPKASPEVEARVRTQLAEEDRLNNVRLTKTVWKKSGLGTIMISTFTIKNMNAVQVKDVEVRCSQFGPSGTLI